MPASAKTRNRQKYEAIGDDFVETKMERAKGFETAPVSSPVSVETGVITHESRVNTRLGICPQRRLAPFWRSDLVMQNHVPTVAGRTPAA